MENSRIVNTDFRQLMESLCDVTMRFNASRERLLLTREYCTPEERKKAICKMYFTVFTAMNSPYLPCESKELYSTHTVENQTEERSIMNKFHEYVLLLKLSDRSCDGERLENLLEKLCNGSHNESYLLVLRFMMKLMGTSSLSTSIGDGLSIELSNEREKGNNLGLSAHISAAMINPKVFSSKPGSHLQHVSAMLGMQESFKPTSYFVNLQQTLYGGLTQSKSTDLHASLDVPDISDKFHMPSQRSYKSEIDEGIGSLSGDESHSTVELNETDSNDLWIWDLNRHKELKIKLSWEAFDGSLHRTPIHLISELGKSGFDHFYNVYLQEKYSLSSTPLKWHYVKEDRLIKDTINVLCGISSKTYYFDKVKQEFLVTPNLRLSGVSMVILTGILEKFATMGSNCWRLQQLYAQQVDKMTTSSCASTLSAFIWSIHQYILSYSTMVTSLEGVTDLTIFQIQHLVASFDQQLSFLVEICCIPDCNPPEFKEQFFTATSLLCYLHDLCLQNSTSKHYFILVYLLKQSMIPFLRYMSEWVLRGRRLDPYHEFFIDINDQYSSNRDKLFWTSLYHLNEKRANQLLPLFFGNMTKDIFDCGKSLNLLRVVKPSHYLFSMEIIYPPVELNFTYNGLQNVKLSCERHVVNIKRLAEQYDKDLKQTMLEDLLEKEAAFVEERQKIKKLLLESQEREKEVNLLLQSKKESELASLKKQLEESIKRKKDLKLKELAQDQMIVLQAEQLDEVQQRRLEEARKDLESKYAALTEEAIKRETKAVWRLKRNEFHLRRKLFLRKSTDEINAEWKKYVGEGKHLIQDSKEELNQETHKIANTEDNGTSLVANEQESESNILNDSSNTPITPADSHPSTPLPSDTVTHGMRRKNDDVDAKTLLYPDMDTPSNKTERQSTPLSDHADKWNVKVVKGTESPSTLQDLLYPDNNSSKTVTPSKKYRPSLEPSSKMKGILYPEELTPGKAQEGLDKADTLLEMDPSWFDYTPSPLQDSYDSFDDKPGTCLIWSQPKLPDDFDETIIKQPLDEIFKRCFVLPLASQIKLVNKALLDYFINELEVEKHFVVLRKFMLLEDGEFGHALANELFTVMTPDATPETVCSPALLNNIIAKALQFSSSSSSFSISDDLSFTLKHLPESFKFSDVNLLDFLELQCKVPWPHNIILTDNSMAKYNKVFSFLLKLRRMNWVLSDIWNNLKRAGRGKQAALSPQLRKLQLFRHEMQHFVNNLDRYTATQIIHCSWQEFQVDLKQNATSIDKLHECHLSYINKIIFRSLLSKNAAPVLKIIYDVFGLILKFHTQLHSSLWIVKNDNTGYVQHELFNKMCTTHAAFKEFTGFLFSVISKLVKRGYQRHLHDLLLQVNFNGHYKTAVI